MISHTKASALLSLSVAEHILHCEQQQQDHALREARLESSGGLECGICLDVVLEKPSVSDRRFGLLRMLGAVALYLPCPAFCFLLSSLSLARLCGLSSVCFGEKPVQSAPAHLKSAPIVHKSRAISHFCWKSSDRGCVPCCRWQCSSESGATYPVHALLTFFTFPRSKTAGCEHVFCLSCVRKWRAESSRDAVVRCCPLCRTLSYFVIPSTYWPATPDEKDQIMAEYKANLRCGLCVCVRVCVCVCGRRPCGIRVRARGDHVCTLLQSPTWAVQHPPVYFYKIELWRVYMRCRPYGYVRVSCLPTTARSHLVSLSARDVTAARSRANTLRTGKEAALSPPAASSCTATRTALWQRPS